MASLTYGQPLPNLELYIPDKTGLCTLNIQDISWYPSNAVIECPTLQVTVPGFRYAVDIPISGIKFNVVLSACDLGLQTDNCDKVLTCLPDGIYVIRYSIYPNDNLYVEYLHMRTVKLKRAIHYLLCCLDSKRIYDAEFRALKEQIVDIVFDLDVLKTMCEYSHKVDEAMKIYSDLVKKVKKLICSYCSCDCVNILNEGSFCECSSGVKKTGGCGCEK